MIQKKQAFFLMVLTALVTAFCTTFFYGKSYHVDIASLKEHLATIEKQEQEIDDRYQFTMTALRHKNDSLSLLVKQHKAELAQADKKTNELEQAVSVLATKVASEPDTSLKKAVDCDSLSKNAVTLTRQYDTAQRICHQTINELSLQLQEKDTAEALCQTSYAKMKMVLDTSVQQQQNMVAQVNILNKKIKRKGFQNRILSLGVFVLSGVAATLCLERR